MLSVAGVVVDEERLAAICERYGVAELIVFGSAARDDLHQDSDVDGAIACVLAVGPDGTSNSWQTNSLSCSAVLLIWCLVRLCTLD